MTQSQPPSDYAIDALVHGQPGGLPRTLGLTAARSLLIAPGLYLAGLRGRGLLTASVAASASITLGMLLLRALRSGSRAANAPEQ